ncbi:hypothetical protein [Citrobacter sp. CtB7.12]|uniref:hypothetical protein n=1 Tax=Citrobacter sp. CtB7.12 TaxID=1696093 RepID=UPI000A462A8E|nr:hypothetical protein [Citrobacter sp. CtB7.12]
MQKINALRWLLPCGLILLMMTGQANADESMTINRVIPENVAYFHERRSPNNIHRDRVITPCVSIVVTSIFQEITMAQQPISIDIKEKGIIWLLPPCSWSLRQVARKLELSPSVVARWRLELVQKGLLPGNEKMSCVDSDE